MTGRSWKSFLLAGFLCLAPSCSAAETVAHGQAAGRATLPIYEQWAGTGSSYPGTPVYQMIRRLEELQQFWDLHKVADPMPHINFETCMLFVWAPGPSRFDYRPLQVLEFRREPQGLFLILGLDRKDTGGFWRGPYLMAILPKQAGHLSVIRHGRKHLREAEFMPMATIYDMGGELTPITQTVVAVPSSGGVKSSGSGKPAEAVTSGNSSGESATPVVQPQASPEPKPADAGSAMSKPAEDKPTEAKSGQSGTDLGLTPGASAPTGKAETSSASDSGDPFNIDF